MKLMDLISKELIDVDCPRLFEYIGQNITTAYFTFWGREYQFRMGDAQMAGLFVPEDMPAIDSFCVKELL